MSQEFGVLNTPTRLSRFHPKFLSLDETLHVADIQQKNAQIQEEAAIIQQKDTQIQQKEEQLRQATDELQQTRTELNSFQKNLQVCASSVLLNCA